MNIFILDKDVTKCAQFHTDKHVVKMILESAQMLCAAVILSGGEAPYRLTHKNHPCTVWARESLSNWLWLRDLMEALNIEWKYRYGHTRNHLSWDKVKNLTPPSIEDKGLTKFAMAMPDSYKTADPIVAYRTYYLNDKRHIASWTRREKPSWWQ
jgi:hypothetical protein